MDQLGADYTVTTYILEDNYRKPVKIESPAEQGRFFKDEVYVVDVQGKTHRYMICWMGPKLTGKEIAETSEAMNIMVGGVLDSSTTRSRVNLAQEPEDFL